MSNHRFLLIAILLLIATVNGMIWVGLSVGKPPDKFETWLSLVLAQALGVVQYVLVMDRWRRK